MPNCVDKYNHCRPPHTNVFLPDNTWCVPYFIQHQPTTFVDKNLNDLSSLMVNNPVNMCSEPNNTYKTDSCEFVSSFSYDQDQIRNLHYKTIENKMVNNYCSNQTKSDRNCFPGKLPSDYNIARKVT